MKKIFGIVTMAMCLAVGSIAVWAGASGGVQNGGNGSSGTTAVTPTTIYVDPTSGRQFQGPPMQEHPYNPPPVPPTINCPGRVDFPANPYLAGYCVWAYRSINCPGDPWCPKEAKGTICVLDASNSFCLSSIRLPPPSKVSGGNDQSNGRHGASGPGFATQQAVAIPDAIPPDQAPSFASYYLGSRK